MKPTTDWERTMDLARRRAAELRNEAMDEFWRAAWDGTRRGARAAARFAASLARHRRLAPDRRGWAR